MEPKKNPNQDLSQWRGVLTNLGLTLSISAVLVAFEWKAKEDKPLLSITEKNSSWENDFIPPITFTPPPPPPSIQPNIKIIDDSEKIDQKDYPLLDIDLPISEPVITVTLKEPPYEDKASEVVDFSEEMASFEGGMKAWYLYLRTNLNYPKMEQKLGLEGTVIVRFVINTDGTIQDVEVIRSAGEGLDKAAMTVIKNSPRWIPGKNGGRPVRSRMTIPIKFKLN